MLPKRLLIGSIVILWSVGVVVGFAYSIQYELTPGEAGTIGHHWPVGTGCELATDRPTLVMFIHPRCPCSRASLTELSLLMTHCRGRVNAQVLFLKPAGMPDGWSKTDLWQTACDIPGVVARWDMEGIEERRFNATLSGEVFLHDQNGGLVFHGGITAARGHSGDNAGRAAIEEYLLTKSFTGRSTPIFGCDLSTRKVCSSNLSLPPPRNSD